MLVHLHYLPLTFMVVEEVEVDVFTLQNSLIEEGFQKIKAFPLVNLFTIRI